MRRGTEDIIRSYQVIWKVALLFLFALIVRSLPYSNVFDNGRIYFFEGDCYLHLRKIFLHIEHFPSFNIFDYYEGYPIGTPSISPPLLDYLVSAISILIGLGNPDKTLVETTTAFIPPIIGAITVVIVFFLTRRIFNEKIALITSAILSIMPAHIEFSILSRFDNEMMEPLMVAVFFYSYLRLLNHRELKESTLNIFLCSIAALLSLLFWRGATIWIIFIAFIGYIDITIDNFRRDDSSKKYLQISSVYLLLSIYIAVICYLNIWGTQNSFSFNIISWFHATIFALNTLLTVSFGWISSLWLRRKWSNVIFFVFLISFFIIIPFAILFYTPSLRENMLAGMGIIGIGSINPWIQTISEFRPLIKGDITIYTIHGYFGWVFWLLPFIIVLISYEYYKKNMDRNKLFFLISLSSILMLTILNRRFMHILAIFVAMSSGWFIYYIYNFLRNNSFIKSIIKNNKVTVLTTFVLSMFLFYPFFIVAYITPRISIGGNIKGDIENAMIWLRDNTPPPDDPYDPLIKPPYSIMAPWDYSGWIEYIGERPTVSSLYGTETFGYRESNMFFSTESEYIAKNILINTKAKYIIVLSNIKELTTVSARLYIADGVDHKSQIISFKGVNNFRLAYESNNNIEIPLIDGNFKKIKIFEFVPGVTLNVKAKPATYVQIESTIKTNQNRTFKYLKSGWTNRDGILSFNLPYGARTHDQETGLIAPYNIIVGNKTKTLLPTKNDIISGKLKEMTFS